MLDFHKISSDDIAVMRPVLERYNSRICDRTIGSLYIWRDLFPSELAEKDGTLFFKADYLGEPSYSIIGADVVGAYRELKESEGKVTLCVVSEEERDALCAGFDMQVESRDEDDDYLYNAADIISLAGKKYSAQRNQIHKFKRLYENYSFDVLTPGDIDEVTALIHEFAQEVDKNSPAFKEDLRMAVETTGKLDELGFVGAALRVDGKMVAFSIGEKVGDTLFVHIEKALREYHGAYQMQVNLFAQKFCSDGDFINREEDDGDEGLRRSKHSYHPCALVKKYILKEKN